MTLALGVLALGPIAAGFLGTLAPAIGWFPALGETTPDLGPVRALMAIPWLGRSLLLGLGTGCAATVLALIGTCALLAHHQTAGPPPGPERQTTHRSAGWPLIPRARLSGLPLVLGPVLAMPHAATAIGFAVLVAPSGWIARLVSPWATGWTRPPDIATIGDSWGVAMTLVLAIKGLAFLLLVARAGLGQIGASRSLAVARTLGYGPIGAWGAVVLPRLYPLIRLPVYALLVYSVAAVEVAAVIGPRHPPPLALQILLWSQDPDLSLRLPAAAAALLQTLVGVAAIGLWWVGERLVAHLGRCVLGGGPRPGGGDGPVLRLGAALVAGVAWGGLILALAGILVLGLWSVAGSWFWPQALPQSLETATWVAQADGLLALTGTTLALALVSTGVAVPLVLALLEHQRRRRGGQSDARPRPTPGSVVARRARGSGAMADPGPVASPPVLPPVLPPSLPGRPPRPLAGLGGVGLLLVLPLLVPQVGFLFGFQVALITLGWDGGFGAVVLAHLTQVLPYVLLVLHDAWARMDPRPAQVAATLGAGPNRVFLAVLLPRLMAPIAVAAAVGFGVSVAQYLPTVFAGGGRIATLTTEAVAKASGGDRRVIGALGLLQALLPLIGLWIAQGLPRLVFRNRRDLLDP